MKRSEAKFKSEAASSNNYLNIEKNGLESSYQYPEKRATSLLVSVTIPCYPL